jgi:4-hydroxybenzoyl-CoA thioesterase
MAFKAHLKVCFGDIDNAGIVYYPRFVHYFHVAMEEFFSAELDLDYATLVGKHSIGFPTVRLEADFKQRLHYGDCLVVEVRIVNMGNTSVTWGYKVLRLQENDVVAEGNNVTVCVNLKSFQKQALPDWLRTLFEQYQKKCLLLEQVARDAEGK